MLPEALISSVLGDRPKHLLRVGVSNPMISMSNPIAVAIRDRVERKTPMKTAVSILRALWRDNRIVTLSPSVRVRLLVKLDDD